MHGEIKNRRRGGDRIRGEREKKEGKDKKKEKEKRRGIGRQD